MAEIKKDTVTYEGREMTRDEYAISIAKQFVKFGKLTRQNLYNPKNESTRRSPTFSTYSKESIISWLQSPTANEKSIRNASIYMYNISPHYYRLVQYYAGMLTWDYVLIPSSYDKSKVQTEAIAKQYTKIAHQLEIMNIAHEMRKASVIAIKEGVFYGVALQDKDSFFLQQINADICRLSSITDGCWNYSVDMSQIQEQNLDSMYPPIFRTMYNTYKSSGERWQEVPDDYSFCVKADESTATYSLPMFASIMPDLYVLENYKSLSETAAEIQNYKMITGQIPLNEYGEPSMDWGLALEYYRHLTNALPDFIGAAITPFELQDFDFDKSGGTSDIDIVARSTEELWSEIGSPASIHGAAASTATALRYAVKADEEICFGLLEQGQRLINRFIKKMSGTVKFKIEVLPITIFNQDERINYYKSAVTVGLGKSYYAASLGIAPYDVAGLDSLEMECLGFDSLTPLLTSYTATGEETSVGRPTVGDDKQAEKTETNKEAQT